MSQIISAEHGPGGQKPPPIDGHGLVCSNCDSQNCTCDDPNWGLPEQKPVLVRRCEVCGKTIPPEEESTITITITGDVCRDCGSEDSPPKHDAHAEQEPEEGIDARCADCQSTFGSGFGLWHGSKHCLDCLHSHGKEIREPPKATKPDAHDPAHYTSGDIEPIDYIKAQGWFPDFACGNIVKYITRYRLKNGVEDLRKAQVYLGWLIEHVGEDDRNGGDA